jgi:hypothetical protein
VGHASSNISLLTVFKKDSAEKTRPQAFLRGPGLIPGHIFLKSSAGAGIHGIPDHSLSLT